VILAHPVSQSSWTNDLKWYITCEVDWILQLSTTPTMTLLWASTWSIYWKRCHPHVHSEEDFWPEHIFRIHPLHKFFEKCSKQVA
jgi:hypothetical protein